MKSQNKLIEFYNNLPVFKNWTRTALLRLNYFFDKRLILKNQEIVKENQNSKYIYLIKEGEFEVEKKHVKENSNHSFDIPKFLEYNSENKKIIS